MLRHLHLQQISVNLMWHTCKPRVLRQLLRNGFAMVFGGPSEPKGAVAVDEHVVRYREDRVEAASILGYLKDHWLGHDWVHISDALRNSIVGTTYEIYANAFEHSGSQIGVTTCGHHSDKEKELSITVVDFGYGIPANVRRFHKDDTISAKNALWWAFQRGTTTRPEFSRGMGFELLKNFVTVNRGRIEVYSGDGYAKVSAGGEEFLNRELTFNGTVVHIVFKCDERRYILASEVQQPQGKLF